jgi:Zn-dependent protease with chaperone function
MVGAGMNKAANNSAQPISKEKPFRFLGGIPRASVSLSYRLGLLVASIVLLALPLIYLAMIAGVAYLIYLHATCDITIFDYMPLRGGFWALFLYVAPLIAGAVLLLFMIKPLFGKRPKPTVEFKVTRQEEPGLYALVEELCSVVGAPMPSEIILDTEVNAGASFKNGFIGWLRRDMALTIGMPLVAGLSAAQFVGVLAHELGHFRQNTGMRLGYLIRRINNWFARLVFGRDKWDASLNALSRSRSHGLLVLIAKLLKMLIWLTRRILFLLMMIGHAVSAFLQREKEYDADRCEAQVIGSEKTIQTFDCVAALGIAENAVVSGLGHAWREHKLPDDLPLYVRYREQELTDEARAKLNEVTAKLRTRWHHTHPSASDRIAAIKRENARGVFECDVSAAQIFTDFPEMSKMATIAFYTKMFGKRLKPQQIVPTESLVKIRDERKQSRSAMDRYFCGLLHPLWPVFLPRRIEPAVDRAAAAEKLLSLRNDFAQTLPAAKPAVESYEAAEKKLATIAAARSIRSAGLKPDPKKLQIGSVDERDMRAIESQAIAEQQSASTAIDAALAIGISRLVTALSLVEPEAPVELPDNDEEFGEISLKDAAGEGSEDRLLEGLTTMRAAAELIPQIGRDFGMYSAVYRQCKPEGNPQSLLHDIVSRSHALTKLLNRTYEALGTGRYPYKHVEGEMSIARYLMPRIPNPRQVQSVGATCNSLLSGYSALYARIMADLSQRAEQIEADMGLPPLDQDSKAPTAVASR